MIAKAMLEGIRRCGEQTRFEPSTNYSGRPTADVAIFYGLAGGLNRVLVDYAASGRRAVYCDLGYWTRRIQTRHDGFHKVSVNSRHPTDYLMAKRHSGERFARHGLSVQRWRPEGRHILIAGMSGKAALAEGLGPNAWEERTIRKLRGLTKRPLIYRPKPSWMAAKRIDGATFDRETPLEEVLKDCHAVVTHHSNVAVDALLAGVPVYTQKGVASLMGAGVIESIEHPIMPKGREQWAHNLAWCQWSVEEMRQGLAYRYLIGDGLI